MATNKYVPSRAALPIIRPALGAQQTISENAKVAMQGYLNHFLGHMDIVNSREVCKFLEVSKLSFSKEYGPKLKEGYVMVKHLPKFQKDDGCCPCRWLNCCNNKWQKVWAVLKPGFLALLEDPFDTNLLDIVVFDMLPTPSKDGEAQVHLAQEIKNRNPLRHSFMVSCGSRRIKLRTTSNAKDQAWISSVNAAALMPTEGWCHLHRFGSYAPPRGLTEDGSQAQWFVDGQAAFEAIAASIESAKSEIYITGWWVCPELYLRRPFDSHGFSRLDALLEAKANRGVQIYILLYKEVALALKINSFYSKRRLLDIHENVKVLRYPDHFSAGVYLWSHHEKLVIVDCKICFIGGLDLCFGRYDTAEHKVGDCPPYIWPGKDYYNPRESEPNSWEDTMKDELDREKYPRMPWHDVHCAIRGPPCHDIARHFVQRWNHAKRSKAPNEQSIPLLMPHHHMVLPHYMGRSKEINIANKTEIMERNLSKPGAIFHQSPSENIPLLLPREADEIKISKLDDKINELNSYQHQNHLDQPSNAAQTVSQVGPPTYCHCQVIRSVSQWSAGTYQTEDSIHRAYCSLIEEAEHFVYIENQFFISGLSGDDIIQNRILEALYRRIMRAHNERKCFRVIIVIPLLPGFQGGLDDSGAATVRALMHWQYRTICRGKHSILHHLKASLGPKTGDYISFCGLRTYGRLSDEGPPVTSQIYVHSKVLIIDDRISVIGSSNINDRSLLGSRDSEIALVIEDKEFLESSMNGEPWKAGKFASTLRLSLWSEHLGLCSEEVARIRDPITDSTYKDLWQQTAKDNAAIYQDVFGCTPNDVIRSRSKLRESIGYWKEKAGHTTIDLGVAPKKIEIIQEEGVTKTIDPMEKLNSIRGFLVVFPLEFMCQEDLRPNFVESEFYASPQVFY